ncbi:MAG: ORF6N domain-containing protein [Candidatus Gastranaerophilales bacterium]|nr:ORF6N domain-containing protein [Candidatus Gastranaerophilales bacterium]
MTKEIENNLTEIKNLIYVIRGQKVMLDSDLAMLYQVETKVLNQAVKRNIERFPNDFMFQLSKEEFENLRSQFVTSPKGGGRQYLPYVFTEQGIAMLSGVLKSKCAIEINIQIMRTFVKLRQWAIENKELAERLTELEHYFMRHCQDNKTDLQEIYKVLALLSDRTRPQEIGFKTK